MSWEAQGADEGGTAGGSSGLPSDLLPLRLLSWRLTIVVAHELIHHRAQVLPQVVGRQQARKHGH